MASYAFTLLGMNNIPKIKVKKINLRFIIMGVYMFTIQKKVVDLAYCS